MLLAQPGRIGRLALKNRVVMAPMGTNFSTTDGLSTERDKMYYAERAKGGVAAIMTEAMVVTEQARPHHNSLCVYHDRFIPGLASIVDAIHRHDCHVFGQLNHRGALLRRSVLDMEPVGPSAWHNPNTGDAVRPLAPAEIEEIQALFVRSARRLVRAGYDGVEIHAGNGYLFQQFLTPRINQRTDRYGGSLENRMRFVLETVDRVRAAIPDTVLIVRLSCTEYVPDGYGEADIVALAQALERAGVDALDLSGGSNESPQLSKFCIQPPSFPRGMLAPHAKPIKQAVSIPCLVAGRIVDPADAEAVLASGSADFISLGRALYADAHWCVKAFGAVPAPIRSCIACNVCFERLTLEKDVACVHNPMMGTEFEALEHAEPQLFEPAPPSRRRRVLVLGAGVAGVEAARVLAARGHEVEVWEKADRPGGQMPLATAAPDKQEVEPIWSYRWNQANALGVPVRTNTVATLEKLRAFGPDFAIVATGAAPRPAPFDLSALDPRIRVRHAWDYLAAPETIGNGARVTIVGGGMVGMEAADLLVARGATVTVIEALATLAQGMARNNRMELVERVRAQGATLVTEAAITGVHGDTLEIATRSDSQPRALAIGDVLLIAIGPRPVRDSVPLLEAAGVPYELAGDCNRPGDFLTAIRDAWMVAAAVEHRAATRSLDDAASGLTHARALRGVSR
jgi:2,4-dienoyl-CoA reductase-like NADH-dependent reductase (Old Yellow Enzyme family)/NADPH-dependent 2,4-dienoyl-CoA reductase/sulfur reductase-like enzyme